MSKVKTVPHHFNMVHVSEHVKDCLNQLILNQPSNRKTQIVDSALRGEITYEDVECLVAKEYLKAA